MKKILVTMVLTVGVLAVPAEASAAPKSPNPAWSKVCTTTTLAGPWKRFTRLNDCTLVNIRSRR